jgi:hypothetical protein
MRAYARAAACGSAADITYFNPWRRPGAAPVFDACGMAGGEPLPGKENMQGAKYTTTVHARQGDLGSFVLPPMPTGTIWTAGKPAEVSWTMRANREYKCYTACLCSCTVQQTAQPKRHCCLYERTVCSTSACCCICLFLRRRRLLLSSLPPHRELDRGMLPAYATRLHWPLQPPLGWSEW